MSDLVQVARTAGEHVGIRADTESSDGERTGRRVVGDNVDGIAFEIHRKEARHRPAEDPAAQALESSALALLRNERGQVVGGYPNRVADAEVLEVATFAEAIHGGRAHAEQLGDLANRKQGLLRTPGRKML